MEQEQTVKTNKGKVKKILSIVGNVLIWLFIVFAIFMTILAISVNQTRSDGSKADVPSIGKTVLFVVATDSMKPTFKSGDLLFSKKLSESKINELKEGDVITFDAGDLNGDGKADLNSHRIIEVVRDGEGNLISVTTKGDAAGASQEVVSKDKIVAKWNGVKLVGIGTFIAFLNTFLGFGLVIILPLVLYFTFELVLFIRKFLKIKNEGKKVITESDEELIKQRAIEEYLRRQQEEQKQDENQEENKEE